ncbi:MAG: hypothetical protein HYU54_04730 [Actinobacteria bacterium]|nr:hypothetical protein [Actinomycetota bacterium]
MSPSTRGATARRGRGALRAALVAIALLGTTLAARTAPAATTCSKPPVFPAGQLAPGQSGVGYTVIDGDTPVSFDVTILGILPDGIFPGIDFILVKVTGPQSFLSATHGIAAGMSGSPVYIDDKLAGAISYGLYGADHTVGGMTPAQPMVDLFDYPDGSPSMAAALARTVRLTTGLRRAVAGATGQPLSATSMTAQPLVVPVAVSGLSSQRLAELQAKLEKRHVPFLLYTSGSSAAPSAPVSTPLPPGGNFASVLSYGDVTVAGVGTLSYGDVTVAGVGTATEVCGDRTVAFGHSLFYYPAGATSLGMNDADVLTVLDDPSGFFGPFKIATIAEARGTVTQDRFVGEVGTAGVAPSLVAVGTEFSTPDLGRSRTGRTDIAYQEGFWLPYIAIYHVVANLDVVFDRIGDGTLRMGWTVEGLREDGSRWEVSRSTMDFSNYDATSGAWELFRALYLISFNKFEDVTFTGVEADGFITERRLEAKIVRVLSSSSLQPELQERSVLRARPGSRITLQVVLEPAEGGDDIVVDLTMKVPGRARGRQPVVFRGGRPPRFFSPRGLGSFDELLDQLSSGDHAFDLIVDGLGATEVLPQETIVKGRAFLTVSVVR